MTAKLICPTLSAGRQCKDPQCGRTYDHDICTCVPFSPVLCDHCLFSEPSFEAEVIAEHEEKEKQKRMRRRTL